jgi:hypothetical protein
MNVRALLKPVGANSPHLTIADLSALVSRNPTSTCKAADPSLALFSGEAPAPDNLAAIFDLIARSGYRVHQPVRFFPASRRMHAQWNVRIESKYGECTLAFLLPLDAA